MVHAIAATRIHVRSRLHQYPLDHINVLRAIQALESVRDTWLQVANIVAVDVGYRMRRGRLVNEIALRVHVKQKLPVCALSAELLLNDCTCPERYAVHGFPVDVIQAKYIPQQAPESIQTRAMKLKPYRQRAELLQGGISIGNIRSSSGTLGAIVYDESTRAPCVLSNWHVLCGALECEEGEVIFQPSSRYRGTRKDTIATLHRWALTAEMDAALALLNGSRPFSRQVMGLHKPVSGMTNPYIGMQVIKSGVSTGVTDGIVDGVGWSGEMKYRDGTAQHFEGQIHIISPEGTYQTSGEGDSGAVWVEKATNKAVGLHFAGDTNRRASGDFALANKIDVVAKNLGFSLVP